MLTIDLHCHSKLSDGSTGIDELIFIARRTKIDTLAVTDHDTFSGALRAKVIGKRYGINIVIGAEFSAYSEKHQKEIHILCYMCEYPDRLEGLCQHNSIVRQKNMALSLQKIMKYYPVSPQTVSTKARGSSNVFKNHILQAVMDAGYSSSDYSSLFTKLFGSHLGVQNKPSFSEPEKVINSIHQAQGVAVLAHPAEGDVENLLPELLEYGLDGVEVYYPDAIPSEQEKLINFAQEHNLLITGGSDFHGMYSSFPRPLGSFRTDQKQLDLMIQHKSRLFA